MLEAGRAAPTCVGATCRPAVNTVVAWSVLERIDDAHPPARADRAAAARCSASSRAAPDSTCLFHALRELGYRVSALHVDHGLRGAESDEDARFCADAARRDVVRVDARGATEAELRDAPLRPARPTGSRATGHTARDQVETILFRLASSGSREGDQAAPRGRRRPTAAAALARGDRGVLPRARARAAGSTPRTRTRCAA